MTKTTPAWEVSVIESRQLRPGLFLAPCVRSQDIRPHQVKVTQVLYVIWVELTSGNTSLACPGRWPAAVGEPRETPRFMPCLRSKCRKRLKFAAAYSRHHGVRITPSLLVAKAISHCLQVRPELNGLLRHGRVYLRRHVSVFFQVNVPGRAANGNRDERIAKALLSGTTVHETKTKSLAEIARAFRAQAAEVKRGRDPAFGAYLCIVSLLPWRLVRGFLNLGSWLVYGLNSIWGSWDCQRTRSAR